MKTTKKKSVAGYNALLKVMGRIHKGQGKSVLEAITKLTPGSINGVVVLSVTGPTQTKQRVISTVQARRAFNTAGITKDASIKSMSLLFNGV